MKLAQLNVSEARQHTNDIFGMYLGNWNIDSQEAVIQLGVATKSYYSEIIKQLSESESAREGDYHVTRFGTVLRIEIGHTILTILVNNGVPDVQIHKFGL